jgi:hypothetical protein
VDDWMILMMLVAVSGQVCQVIYDVYGTLCLKTVGAANKA